jgi:hypothetical protein
VTEELLAIIVQLVVIGVTLSACLIAVLGLYVWVCVARAVCGWIRRRWANQ